MTGELEGSGKADVVGVQRLDQRLNASAPPTPWPCTITLRSSHHTLRFHGRVVGTQRRPRYSSGWNAAAVAPTALRDMFKLEQSRLASSVLCIQCRRTEMGGMKR
jgi:hypothetical protein